MQNKINKIKHTGVYVLVVDDYLYKTGDIFGEWIFLPMDSPAISKYDDTYVIIKYDLSDITNQTQKNWIQKQIEQNKHNISRLNNILIAYDKLPMKEIPIWEKSNLSLEEAAAYSGIGINKLREITNEDRCKFVLWVGNKRLIKRRLFDQFIEQAYSI